MNAEEAKNLVINYFGTMSRILNTSVGVIVMAFGLVNLIQIKAGFIFS